jgi:cellulose synthase/poly-beta-1,6-N-acetylglucosamine synthase-like glycosyltransferase
MVFRSFMYLSLLALNGLLLPRLIYILTVTAAAIVSRNKHHTGHRSNRRFQVVIPAHDEEAGIARTVGGCLAIDYPHDWFEVVVIADNCTDRTAELAAGAGATVVDRFDPTDRSKGHALKYYFDRLETSGEMDRLDALVVVDADTEVDPDLLSAFAVRLADGSDWIQPFGTISNPDDSWRTRLMAYSFSLINGVMLQGQAALGLSATFRGNGMCLSVRGLRRHPWQSTGLTEDLDYSWSLRLAGETIAFAPEVSVYATMPVRGGEAATTQRQRWEYGRRETRRQMLSPLIHSRNLRPLGKLAAFVELTMPPSVNLVGLFVVTIAFNLCFLLFQVRPARGPAAAAVVMSSTLSTLSLLLYAISPCLVFHLPWKTLLSLAYVPVFAAWKWGAILRGRPRHWIRTARESRPSD